MHTNASLKEPDFADLEYLQLREFKGLRKRPQKKSRDKMRKRDRHAEFSDSDKHGQGSSKVNYPTPVRVY